MMSRQQSIKAPIISKAPPPIIIAHNCGYLSYKVKPYSKAATVKAYKDCDYLEIDLTLKKDQGKDIWWYSHEGLEGEKENRKDGVSLDDFLKDFKDAAENSKRKRAAKKRKLKPGIFLDLKKRLNHRQVDELMDYLNDKYKKDIPKGTPLMIFTGRGSIPHFGAVYRHTTLYFVKWLYKNRKKRIMSHKFCPKLTLVTREVKLDELAEWRGILEPFRKSHLNVDEKEWFLENLNKNRNKKFWWAFNPYPFWLFKYDFERIFDCGVTVIPWFSKYIPQILNSPHDYNAIRPKEPKERKKPSNKQEEEKEKKFSKKQEEKARIIEETGETERAWIKVILRILEKYWLHESWQSPKKTKSPSWGLITYIPKSFKETLRKWSFSDIQ